MFKEYFSLITLVVGIGIGYLLTRTRNKTRIKGEGEEKKSPAGKKEKVDCDVFLMEGKEKQ